jgi:hypothetical protein
VRLGQRDAHRHDRVDEGEQPERNGEDAVQPAPARAGRSLAPVQPRDRDRQPDEHDARRRGENAGEIARRSSRARDVLDVQHAVDGRERPEEQGEGRAQPRTQPGEGVDGGEPEHERDRRGERVLTEADAGLAMEEGVVERVNEGDGGRGAEDECLARAARRSGSRLRALRDLLADHGRRHVASLRSDCTRPTVPERRPRRQGACWRTGGLKAPPDRTVDRRP